MDPLFIGQIILFAGNFAPRNWALCDGQLLPISNHKNLFSILGTAYGGDGRTTFGLPDLRGRVAVHAGRGPGLSNYPLGQKGGTEEVTLSIANMPSHNHGITGTLRYNNDTGNSTEPMGGSLAIAPSQIYHADGPEVDNFFHANTIAAIAAETGSDEPFTNRDPYQAFNFIIALSGAYPIN